MAQMQPLAGARMPCPGAPERAIRQAAERGPIDACGFAGITDLSGLLLQISAHGRASFFEYSIVRSLIWLDSAGVLRAVEADVRHAFQVTNCKPIKELNGKRFVASTGLDLDNDRHDMWRAGLRVFLRAGRGFA